MRLGFRRGLGNGLAIRLRRTAKQLEQNYLTKIEA
jgi:hypothetical protein